MGNRISKTAIEIPKYLLLDICAQLTGGEVHRAGLYAWAVGYCVVRVTPLDRALVTAYQANSEGMPRWLRVWSVVVFAAYSDLLNNIFVMLVSNWLTGRLVGRSTLRDMFSKVVWWLKLKTGLKPEVYRQVFTDTPMLECKVVMGHTHGKAAASRSTAVAFMEHYAGAVGLKYYSVQMSAADVRHGQDGDRTFYWAKDLQTAPEVEHATEDHLVSITDVDYYMDMPKLLTSRTILNPIAVYTFIPDRVCGQGENYAFTFNERDELCMSVTGGATYQHMLWNYSQDTVVAVRTWFGIPIRASAWLVDKRKVSDERYVVLLTPLGFWGPLGTWFLKLGMTSLPELTRLRVFGGGFLRLKIHRPDGMYISTSRVGAYLAATIGASEDDTCRTLARLTQVKLSVPTLQSVVKDPAKAAVLVDFYRQEIRSPENTVYPVGLGVRRYQVFNSKYDPMARPSLIPYMSPIVHGTFAPDQTRENEKYAVEERIVTISSDVQPNHMLIRFMDEFLARMFPLPGFLVPVGVDEVYAKQERPQQRRQLDAASVMLAMVEGMRIVKSFLKKEAYQGLKPPRVISKLTLTTNSNILNSCTRSEST